MWMRKDSDDARRSLAPLIGPEVAASICDRPGHLTTSDRKFRTATIHHNNATHRLKSIEVIQDNA
jgi:hypothetical protein